MTEQRYLDAFFQQLWQGKEPFAEVERLTGELFRRVKSRRTLRIELEGRGFFLKHHLGVGWREILKNLLQGKLPVLGAGNEFAALQLLHQIGVPTMTPAAYGQRGGNPARRESFLITEELTNTISMEDLAREWAQTPPSFRTRQAFLARLARSAQLLHDHGVNHRDFYLCHFLLDRATAAAAEPVLYLIDLHRAQIRRRIPFRYRVKDVAGLYFSSMDAPLTRRDCFRFMKLYRRTDLRRTLREAARFSQAVERTARKLYVSVHQHPAPEF